MQLKTSNSEDIKTVVGLIQNIADEATFKANSEGINFRGMDPSHVVLCDISLPSGMFDEYECNQDTNFGVRVDELLKLVKRADKKDGVEILIDEQNRLGVNIGSNKKYKIRLLESPTNETPLPKIELANSFMIENSKFDSIISDIQVIAEYITLSASNDKIEFKGEGESGSVVVDNQDLNDVKITEDGEGSYSLEYLSPAIKSLSASGGSIKLSLSDNRPLKIEFNIGSSGKILFFLAPRVSR